MAPLILVVDTQEMQQMKVQNQYFMVQKNYGPCRRLDPSNLLQ